MRGLCDDAQVHWDDLRYALAVARARTLSAAAEALGVSHTTVGRRLRALEEHLGLRLFDVGAEGYTATDAGRDLVAVAERMETETLSFEGRVFARDERLTGALRVSTMELVFRMFREVFTSFVARHPGVALTVSATDDEVSLTRREADVALRLNNTPPEHLVGRRVGRVQFGVYAARSLVARVGADAPLGAYPWIHWDERLDMRWLDAWLAQHAPGAEVVMRVDVSAAAEWSVGAVAVAPSVHVIFGADPTTFVASPHASRGAKLWFGTSLGWSGRAAMRVQRIAEATDEEAQEKR